MIHEIERIQDKDKRRIAKDFVDAYHSYINWSDRPSRKLYWLLYEDNEIVGVFGLGSAFTQPKPVKEFLAKHGIKFNEVANNIVYCIHGHSRPHADSKFLSLLRKDAIAWWYERYGDLLRAFQTFILPPRTGKVYKADNWNQLGQTTGGTTRTIRTIKKKDVDKYSDVKKTVFDSGEVRYFIREHRKTEPKIIFMKLTSKKELSKITKPLKEKNK